MILKNTLPYSLLAMGVAAVAMITAASSASATTPQEQMGVCVPGFNWDVVQGTFDKELFTVYSQMGSTTDATYDDKGYLISAKVPRDPENPFWGGEFFKNSDGTWTIKYIALDTTTAKCLQRIEKETK